MQKKAKIALAVGLTTVVAAAAATHYAWQEGMVPTSVLPAHPRAPLPENFLAALKADSSMANALKPACLSPQLGTSRKVDRMGMAGLSHQPFPGWDVVSIAEVPAETGQSIENLMEALDALAQAGLYVASESEFHDDTGAQYKVRHYGLSLAGWKATSEPQCLIVGKPRAAEILEFSRVLSDTGNSSLYEVKASYKLDSLPPWARNAAVQRLIPPSQLKSVQQPVVVSARLRRSDSGWSVEATPKRFPDLAREEVLDLVTRSRSVTAPQACIRLPRSDSASRMEVQTAPYAITVYDQDGAADYGGALSHRVMWQSRLARLVSAGVFRQEPLEADKARNLPSGTRYLLDPEYQKWVDLNDAQCLRMGDATADLVDLVVTEEEQREAGRGKAARGVAKLLLRLDDKAWIEGKDLALPEVEAAQGAGGVPAIAHLTWAERSEDKAWQLVNILAPRSDPVPTPENIAEAQRLTAVAQQAAAERDSGSAARVTTSATALGGAATDDVLWRPAHHMSRGGINNAGLTATYCCAGAYSAALSTRPVASGKVYAEFTLTARARQQKGDTYTSLGVVPGSVLNAEGEVLILNRSDATMAFERGDEISHNDTIGLAIDMDRGQLHISRNGAWLSSAPGSGAGLPLKSGRPQYVTAVLSASSSSGGTDSWTANFGRNRFRYPIPPGYRSYDGKQRGG